MKLLNQALAEAQVARGGSRSADPSRPERRPEVLTASEPFEILGVVSNATEAEIRVAYERSVGLWHPDLHGDIERDVGLKAVSRLDQAYREAMRGRV
jgi:hypothetical protein